MTKLEVIEPAHPMGLQLPISAALLRCLSRATSPLVFLPQLSDRFLRLQLQLVQRYATWMKQAFSSRASSDPNQQQQQAAPPPATSEAGSEGGGAPSGLNPAVNPSWVANLPVEDLAVLLRDLQVCMHCSEVPLCTTKGSNMPHLTTCHRALVHPLTLDRIN